MVATDRPSSVILVDPNDIFRSGCRTLFIDDTHFEVMADVPGVAELQPEALTSLPDIVVLDPQLGGTPDISQVLAVQSIAPGASVVVVLDRSDAGFAARAADAGVRVILLKARLSGRFLLHVARLVTMSDAAVIDSTLLAEVLRRPGRTADVRSAPSVLLTARETEILHLLAGGMSDQEIARSLGVARTTIHSHVSSMLRKVPATNRVQLGIAALRAGLLADMALTDSAQPLQ